MNDPQDPHSSGLTYEFEVKEQDRWLPIANGMSALFPFSIMIRVPVRPLPSLDLRCMAAVALAPALASKNKPAPYT